MSLWDALRSAFLSISATKLRSGLTILGIVIGISAVISLMSIGRGARAEIASRIEGIGTNLLFVQPLQVSENRVSGAGAAAALTLEDAEALADFRLVPSVVAVAPQATTFAQIVVGAVNMPARVYGTTPEFLEVRNFTVSQGEFIQPLHLTVGSLVVVLGANVAETLFPYSTPMGQLVRINRRPFRVIGILEPEGGTAFGAQDDSVIMPITTMFRRLQSTRSLRGGQRVNLINLQVADADLMETAKEQATEVLRQQHRIVGEDDFQITSQEDLVEASTQIADVFTLVLGAIAGISLLVGGIGIMNIMLVSVLERTREIGIRKAVGARRRDILLQFLVEAVILSFSGGLLGITLGWIASQLLTRVQIQGQALPSQVGPDIVLLAVSVSVAIGLFFGIVPASRAARLDPIECLRSE